MPSTGVPSSSSFGSAVGAPASNTELGPPENTMPLGSKRRTNSTSQPFAAGWISQYTWASRMRRAINCVYCEP